MDMNRNECAKQLLQLVEEGTSPFSCGGLCGTSASESRVYEAFDGTGLGA